MGWSLRDNDVIAMGKSRVSYLSASQDSGYHATAAMKHETQGASGGSAAHHASFKVLSGSSTGLEVPVVKTVTRFGKPEVSLVAVSHRRHGYFVAHLAGNAVPTLNGTPVDASGMPLEHNDVLELDGTGWFMTRDKKDRFATKWEDSFTMPVESRPAKLS